MLEKEVKKSLIGFVEENGITYIELFDKNNNIKKENLINFLIEKENKNKIIKEKNEDEYLYNFKKEKKFINQKILKNLLIT